MRFSLFFLLVFILSSCGTNRDSRSQKDKKMIGYGEMIEPEELKEHVYLLASDVLEGRKTGEKGQELAVNYITAHYQHLELEAPERYPKYKQNIPKSFFQGNSEADASNIIAYILGSEKPEEVIIISGHFDHLGKINGQIYNGADDNGSGTAAIMEIAESFQMAAQKGDRPKRSILFLHLTGEEIGLYGSDYYTRNSVFALSNTVANLNIDMIGRIDPKHEKNPEYLYLIGSDRQSEELHELSEKTNKKFTQLKLDYTYNKENDPNRFFYRSDHYNFAKRGIPVIFYFNGEHADYHQPTDDANKLDYDLLSLRAKLIFYTAWELANSEERIKLDVQKP